jgi:transposase
MGMLYAPIDVHKSVLQAAVLDPASGELSDARFPATREALREWAMPLRGEVTAVAIEATSGWRWVWRELNALGFDVRLAEPAQTRALRGKKRKAKNDRLDARWLALLLAKAMLPQSWVPPEDIQRLRDLTRLRQALLVEESAEEVAPWDLRRVKGRYGRRIGSAAAIRRSQVERSVWTLLVEVADVDAEDVLELAATEDQEPVEAFPAHAADPAFGVGVCVRRLDRCSDDPDALAAEDAVEGAA